MSLVVFVGSNPGVIVKKYIIKLKYTPAVKSNILSKLIFASCERYSDRAHYGLCVLI